MLRVLRWIGIGLLGLVMALAAVLFAARFHDGPVGPLPGGPFRFGEAVAQAPADWSFAAAELHLELEVTPDDPRSLTTSLLVLEGRLHVPSILAERKRWPREVSTDGRVRVRLLERIYALQAERVTDPARIAALRNALAEKYGRPGEGELDETIWFFRLEPRPAS